jgi:hypothetical protein
VKPELGSGAGEWWIFYNTSKFSGKKLVVEPGATVDVTEPGVYSLLVWSGSGRYGGHDVKGGEAGMDELLVSYDAAVSPHTVENTGRDDLVVLKFFGPDVQTSAPTTPVMR